jgi:hypothetical protein
VATQGLVTNILGFSFGINPWNCVSYIEDFLGSSYRFDGKYYRILALFVIFKERFYQVRKESLRVMTSFDELFQNNIYNLKIFNGKNCFLRE